MNRVSISSDNGLSYSALSHYLNRCWVIVNCTLWNKLQWNFNQDTKLFIYENASENIVCDVAAILSRGGWVRRKFVEVMALWISTPVRKTDWLFLLSHALTSIHLCLHDHVIKWKHFPRYWPFVWGIHRAPMNSASKGMWRGALIFFFFFWSAPWINDSINNREAGNLRRHRAHCDVIVMINLQGVPYFPHLVL